jgi:hypothetical protein
MWNIISTGNEFVGNMAKNYQAGKLNAAGLYVEIVKRRSKTGEFFK